MLQAAKVGKFIDQLSLQAAKVGKFIDQSSDYKLLKWVSLLIN